MGLKWVAFRRVGLCALLRWWGIPRMSSDWANSFFFLIAAISNFYSIWKNTFNNSFVNKIFLPDATFLMFNIRLQIIFRLLNFLKLLKICLIKHYHFALLFPTFFLNCTLASMYSFEHLVGSVRLIHTHTLKAASWLTEFDYD